MRLVLYRGKWAVTWRDGGRTQRQSLRTADRAEAERRLADWRAGVNRQDGDTVSAIFAGYCIDLEARGKDAERLQHAWKRLAGTFGALRPDQVTRTLCRAYTAARRADGAGDGTIKTELGRLSTALRWHDKRTPAVFEMPTAPAPKDRFLTREEYAALRDAARSDHVRLFITLALATAARKGALLDLTWDRVDFERGQINLGAGVGNKGRAVVPMTRGARKALEAARAISTTDYVIEYGGRQVASIDAAFGRAVARAGIERCSPHDLRRTAARRMVEAGVDMHIVAQYLGHTNAAVTARVYARFSPNYLAGAAQALEDE